VAEGPGTPRGRGASGANPRTSRAARRHKRHRRPGVRPHPAGLPRAAARAPARTGVQAPARAGALGSARIDARALHRTAEPAPPRTGEPALLRTAGQQLVKTGALALARTGAPATARTGDPSSAQDRRSGAADRGTRRAGPGQAADSRREATPRRSGFFSVRLASIQPDPHGCRRRRIPGGWLGAWRTPRPGRAPR